MLKVTSDLLFVVLRCFSFLLTVNMINIVICNLPIHTTYKNKTTSNNNAAYFWVSLAVPSCWISRQNAAFCITELYRLNCHKIYTFWQQCIICWAGSLTYTVELINIHDETTRIPTSKGRKIKMPYNNIVRR